jgi:hypothetical protein
MKLVYAFLLLIAVYLLFPLHIVMDESLFPDPKSGGHGLLFMLGFCVGMSFIGGIVLLVVSFIDDLN